MAYKKYVWKSKDRITKEKLNNIEEGIYEVHKIIGENKDLTQYQLKEDDSLLTSNKNISEAINELFQSVSNGKTLIASAITDKGITTSNTSTFQQLAKNIKLLQTTSFNNVIVIIDGKKYKLTEDNSGNITATLVNFSIHSTLTNCRNNNSNISISYGASYNATITANSNYSLTSVTVIMGGTDITSTAYLNGRISITSVTGDIEIIATADAVEIVDIYTITKTLNNCSLSNTISEISEGGSYSSSVIVNSEYEINSVKITMGGLDITSTAFNSNTNSINISNITGNIEITIKAISVSKECTRIQLNKTNITFTNSNTETLIATVTPSNCTDTIYWYTNNEAIATVTNGIVIPVSNGSCTITAVCGTQSANCTINVNIVVTEENMSIPERVMDLMYPMPQVHACMPNGAPKEWQYQSIMYNQSRPEGWTAVDTWLQVYRAAGTDFTINTGVEISNLQVYGWKDNKWTMLKQILIPKGNFYSEDYSGNTYYSFSQSMKTTGNSVIIKLTSDMIVDTNKGVKNVNYRAGTNTIHYESDFEYIFVSAKMRKVKWNDKGIDDVNNSKYCANCSGRWVEAVNSPYYTSIAQPKFTEITTNWKLFAMTTVPENWDKGFPITEL